MQVYIVQYIVHWLILTIHCTVYSVHCVHYTLYIVQCTLKSTMYYDNTCYNTLCSTMYYEHSFNMHCSVIPQCTKQPIKHVDNIIDRIYV